MAGSGAGARQWGWAAHGSRFLTTACLWLVACQKPVANDVHEAVPTPAVSSPCARDQVRESFCDDLLPLSSSRPAPEPYDNCPGSTDIRPGAYPPVGRVAGFDPGLTDYTRARVQPGHSCCYSWCAKIELGEPSEAAPAACRDAYGLPETYCMRELEGGSAVPATSPFERCAAAIRPPESVAFSVPASALLDLLLTAQRRNDTKLRECCYAWCSKAPAGTVLKTHPKIK